MRLYTAGVGGSVLSHAVPDFGECDRLCGRVILPSEIRGFRDSDLSRVAKGVLHSLHGDIEPASGGRRLQLNRFDAFESRVQSVGVPSLSVDDIETLFNAFLVQDLGKVAGFRSGIGFAPHSNAKHVYPHPEDIAPLLEVWLARIIRNGSPGDDVGRALAAYLYFIAIHPFSDGNGRFARLFCYSILSGGRAKFDFSVLMYVLDVCLRRRWYQASSRLMCGHGVDAVTDCIEEACKSASLFVASLNRRGSGKKKEHKIMDYMSQFFKKQKIGKIQQ